MAKSPAALLIDENGNYVGVVLDGSVYRLQQAGKVQRASDGAYINPATQETLATRASEATLLQADGRLTTIDAVLDSIKDTDGIKKITDQLPAGSNEIGAVKQGTKAAQADAWPQVLVDDSGNAVTVTQDGVVYRLEITGKVSVVGALPPPSTTAVDIFADTPLTVGSHDTTWTIPSGETFRLQNITVGNEDPTKGAVTEIIFDDGTEHVVERVYTTGQSISISFPDETTARDGTTMTGNGTNTIIVRRAKYSGTNIAIDAVVRGYY